MRKRKREYVTLSSEGAYGKQENVQTKNTSNADSDEIACVVHQSRTLKEECGDRVKSKERNPRVLVVARSKTTRVVTTDLAEAGLSVYTLYCEDRRFESYVKGAQGKVCLGPCSTEALYENAYAVLEASRNARVDALLLCDSSCGLADDPEFLSFAQVEGVRVYRLLAEGSVRLGWVLCDPPREFSEPPRWRVCSHCGLTFSEKKIIQAQYGCPSCGRYLRMSSQERIDSVLDEGSFLEWNVDLEQTDPLKFPGYVDKVRTLQQTTGLIEAVRTGEGCIAGLRVAFGVMDSSFLMGSLGSVVGEKIARMVERATDEGLPIIICTASGGARMQEGLVSLMQMAKISNALARHSASGFPYIAVLTDPTTGGVTASFAMQGDVIIAEPGALIGFAGQRVIRDTIKQELPEGFQTAEFALEHGLIDAIVARENLRECLAHLIALHKPFSTTIMPGEQECLVSYASVCSSLMRKTPSHPIVVYEGSKRGEGRYGLGEGSFIRAPTILFRLISTCYGTILSRCRNYSTSLKSMRAGVSRVVKKGSISCISEIESAELVSQASKTAPQKDALRAWHNVQTARNTRRPTAQFYINRCVDGFIELHGDRMFGDDSAMLCGLGWMGGEPVTVIAQEKGLDLNERLKRNFGCPQPEGYRKSLRLMKQAEKFHRPIVFFVDTQGAFCGTEAEEHGQGNAIADNLLCLAQLRVPLVSVVIGEGGSGGALALALADRVAMQEHAVYSVLSPEGFASILWKDRTRASQAAEVMKITAEDAYELGIVDAVIPEGPSPAHDNPEIAAHFIMNYLDEALMSLKGLSPGELLSKRYDRFRKY